MNEEQRKNLMRILYGAVDGGFIMSQEGGERVNIKPGSESPVFEQTPISQKAIRVCSKCHYVVSDNGSCYCPPKI